MDNAEMHPRPGAALSQNREKKPQKLNDRFYRAAIIQ
jgi:hypothetical protein